MFLSDIALFARKGYEEYLRENKPELYDTIKKNRSYLKKRLTAYPEKQRGNKHKPFRNNYNKNKYSTIGEVKESTMRENMSWLGDRQKRNAPMQDLRNPLPKLQNAQRGVAPLDTLQPKPRPVLSDLSQIPTSWNKPGFDAVTSKHNGRSVVNPVNNSMESMGAAKPVTQVITPKAPKPSSKEAKRLLKNLGVAGIVGGGMLGAYGLKKYADSRNNASKEKR